MSRSLLRAVLKNEIGQMSVFIALLFQLLFVLFAMVVNIGMVVHDKINLQNAVDLAAYYGAERQAEILNEIAHLNYQIRQDYKLMAFRYRVEGTLGRQGLNSPTPEMLPPAVRDSANLITDKLWVNPAYHQARDLIPSVCVSNFLWSDMVLASKKEENYCYLSIGTNIPSIPDVKVIASFVPLVGESAAFTKIAQQQRAIACKQSGPRNWAFAAQTFYAYKLAAGTRKSAIWALRQNLVSNEFTDHDGNAVSVGMKKTLEKNLTSSNKTTLGDVQIINGLSLGGCGGNGGAATLPEVQTAPVLMYTWNEACDVTGGETPEVTYASDTSSLDSGELDQWDSTGTLRQITAGEPDATNPLASTLGFEKNPWCMAYVGVKAETKPYKPFAPFGSPVTLEARGFAQPFGGRIGPWYKSRWSKGSGNSDGGDRVDPLTTSRFVNGSLDATDLESRLFNFSRFPGDTMGLKSELALGAQRKTFFTYKTAAQDKRLYLKWFSKIGDVTSTGDNLASDPDNSTDNPFNGAVGPLRYAEVSAVTPDLFDATYYSIEPKFYYNYVQNGAGRFASAKTVDGGTAVKEFADLGSKVGAGTYEAYDIKQQITDSFSSGFDTDLKNKLYYPISDWVHLLNSWVSNAANDYSFPAGRFAQCNRPAPSNKYMVPGNCVEGGRVGYSVRIVSKAALNYDQWQIGGANEAPGALTNAPADF